MNKAQANLVVAALDTSRRVAWSIAKRLPPWMDRDEMKAIAQYALVLAALRYRGEPTMFVRYASQWVRSGIYEAVRTGQLSSSRVIRNQGVVTGVRESVSLSSGFTVSVNDRFEELIIRKATLRKLFTALVPLKAEILKYVARGDTLAEIGNKVGLSEARVCELKREAIQQLSRIVA